MQHQENKRSMRVAGIICEYNPFHNGHAHHIEKTRQAGADYIVCVMSGDYVQRGEAAIINKWSRARAAIACGADLVFELPLTWALSPAKRFADGAVFLLNALGCIDTLSFGSESGSIFFINEAIKILATAETQKALHGFLMEGKSYAAAAEAALSLQCKDCARVLSTANDTLGVEYLSALRRLDSNMQPFAVKRMEGGTGYRAELLRNMLRDNEGIGQFLPEDSARIFCEEQRAGRVVLEVPDTAVLPRLCSMRTEDFAALPEVREGLENRLYRAARNTKSLDEFYGKVKTKRFTHASLKRMVMNALLGIRADDWHEIPPYLHVLAMSERGTDILRLARKTAGLPILHAAGQVRKLDKKAQSLFALERRAQELWEILSQL